MSFTIGRASFTNDLAQVSHRGDAVTVSFNILPATLAEAKVLRQQVLGLANNADEPVIPFTWSADSDYDGFYRVGSVRVDPVQAYQTNRLMRCVVSMTRVGGGYLAAPAELVWVNTDRGISAADDPEVWTPTTLSWSQLAHISTGASRDRTTETGDVTGWNVDNDTDTSQFAAYPADHYDGAATIEGDFGGTWYELVGTQIPRLDPGEIRIGNGLVRVTWQSDGDIELAVYDGTTWDAVADLIFDLDGSTVVPAGQPTIIRNSPETCVLRFGTNETSSLNNDAPLTVAAHRGQLFLSAVSHATVAASSYIGAKTTTASTAITHSATDYGVYQTANGGTGHRFVLLSEKATSVNTTEGRVNMNVSAPLPFAMGVNLDGTSSAADDDPADIQNQYGAAMSLHQAIVSI